MKDNLVFKEITRLNTPYFNLQEVLQALLEREILVKKLQYNGIDGTALKWFNSYLSNRKQYISSQDISGNCLDNCNIF